MIRGVKETMAAERALRVSAVAVTQHGTSRGSGDPVQKVSTRQQDYRSHSGTSCIMQNRMRVHNLDDRSQGHLWYSVFMRS